MLFLEVPRKKEEEEEREVHLLSAEVVPRSTTLSLFPSRLLLLLLPPPPCLNSPLDRLSPIAMRSTLASTRGTVAARATKQQAVAAAPAAAPAAKPVSAIETKKTTQFAARLFSAAAAAMIAVIGPAFADLNSLEAAAGGGKKEIGMEGGNEGREMSKLEEFFFSALALSTSNLNLLFPLFLLSHHPRIFINQQSSASARPSSLETPPSTARISRNRTCAVPTSRAPSAGEEFLLKRSFVRLFFVFE